MRIATCVRWVDPRPEIDPLTGEVAADPRRRTVSPADEAALETALRLAEEWSATVTLISAGPADIEADLRDLAAAGGDLIDRVVRVEGDDIATGLAAAASDATFVVCGDVSLDGGSGATPAFVAHHLRAAQALGLVEVTAVDPGVVEGVRRLGAGRAERLRVSAPAVLSVEGSVAGLRRASLPATITARRRTLDVVVAASAARQNPATSVVATGPWRPRTRVVAPPVGTPRERIVTLTGALVDRTPPRVVEADPAEAADAIVEQLRDWGYLP